MHTAAAVPPQHLASTCTPLANLANRALSRPGGTGAWMATQPRSGQVLQIVHRRVLFHGSLAEQVARGVGYRGVLWSGRNAVP